MTMTQTQSGTYVTPPMTVDQALDLAHTRLKAGLIEEAQEICRQVLSAFPDEVPAMLMLADIKQLLGHSGEAAMLYRRILDVQPYHVDTWFRLGNLQRAEGDLETAITSFQTVVAINPRSAAALNNLGNCLIENSQFEAALTCYLQAVEQEPGHSGYWLNAGVALRHMEKLPEAIPYFRQALSLDGNSRMAVIHLANALKDHGKFRESVEVYRHYLQFDPDSADAHNNLGIAYGEQDCVEQAISCFRKALELNPNFPEAHNNLGNALIVQGNLEEAIGYLRQALVLKPDYGDAHFNLSVVLLAVGNYAEGFQKYGYRWTRKDVKKPVLSQPEWTGETITEKTILLLAEQGLGDTIQFVRFANQVKQRGAHVLFNCPKSLVSLLSEIPGVDRVICEGDPLPHFNVYAPLMSLPGILDISLEDVPSVLPVPYLHAPQAYLDYWREQLGERGPGELRVGIAWQGNPIHTGDRHRSIPLRSFIPLASVPGIRLFSFQKTHGVEQISALSDQLSLECFPHDPGRESDPFLDSAALMSLMDVIVTIDSAPAHLAGALGVPTWLACSFKAEWRWLTEREDSPWYPSVRIFRQSKLNVWDDVFERISKALTQWHSARP